MSHHKSKCFFIWLSISLLEACFDYFTLSFLKPLTRGYLTLAAPSNHLEAFKTHQCPGPTCTEFALIGVKQGLDMSLFLKFSKWVQRIDRVEHLPWIQLMTFLITSLTKWDQCGKTTQNPTRPACVGPPRHSLCSRKDTLHCAFLPITIQATKDLVAVIVPSLQHLSGILSTEQFPWPFKILQS